MLVVDRLSKSYGTQTLWSEISFTLKPGEIVILIGPSGCGKTTLLHAIGGLADWNAGALTWRDTPLRPNRHHPEIGLALQSAVLLPHLDVVSQITLPLHHVLKMPKAHARVRALQALAQIDPLLDPNSTTAHLSGGQRQRVALARALAMRPKLLCLDEPTSAQDPQRTQQIATRLQQEADNGMAILIVTHDESLLRALPSAGRIAIAAT